jgi:dTDP-4-dehydrorhamnose 3,5-epimerase
MPFSFEATGFEGLVKIQPRRFDDDRGWFLESYKHSEFAAAGIDVQFVQDNHSCSKAGTLRGLHYQLGPRAQGKLVRVMSGAIFDVAVDVRRASPTFGRWFGMHISAKGGEMLWIAPGFAHGFLALEDNTQLVYKCTAEYDKTIERSILWDDPAIGIAWPELPGLPYLLSPKDAQAPVLQAAEVLA